MRQRALNVNAIGANNTRAWRVLSPIKFCSPTAAKLAVIAQMPMPKIHPGTAGRQSPARPSTTPIPAPMAAS